MFIRLKKYVIELSVADECADNFSTSSNSSHAIKRGNGTLSRKQRVTILANNRRKCFSRAASWTTAGGANGGNWNQMRRFQQQQSTSGAQSPGGARLGGGATGVSTSQGSLLGGSTNNLVRQRFASGAERIEKVESKSERKVQLQTGGASRGSQQLLQTSLSGGSGGGTNSPRRRPHISEFKRMRSFHHVMAFRCVYLYQSYLRIRCNIYAKIIHSFVRANTFI